MKILHTSDWHLGMSLKLGTMIDDQRFFLNQLYEIIKSENIDAVILAGDVYDTSVTNAEAIELYNEAITEICAKLNKKMIVIAGNHDSGARLASGRELLKGAGLYVSGKITKDTEPVSVGNADIYPIPFFNREEVAFLFPVEKEKIKTTEDATNVYCKHIRDNMDKSKVNIAVAHSFITDSELSKSDRAAEVGMATAVSKEVFEGFDYVALGHIHKPQVISDKIRYSGSPIKYSFGKEEAQQKMVIVFDTETMEQKEIYLKQNHERKSFEGSYDEIINLKGCENDYLSLKVTDRVAGRLLFSEFSNLYPNLLELSGMIDEATGEASTITIEELEDMNDESIMERFLKELYDFTPDEEQMKIFRKAVAESEEEDMLG